MPCVRRYLLALLHILSSCVILVVWTDISPVYQEVIVSMAMFTYMLENIMCAHNYEVNYKIYYYPNYYGIVGTYMSWGACYDQWKWYVTSDCKNVRL